MVRRSTGTLRGRKPPHDRSDPIIRRRGAVIILDALGMKGIWQRGGGRRIVHRLYHVSAITRKHIDEPRYLHLAAEGMSRGELSRDHAKIRFYTQTVSDTVIITAHSEIRAGPLLRHIAADLSGLYRIALAHGVIYRGAVSFGDFYRQGNALVGPAVDESAEWHALPDCAGVILTPSAGAAIDNLVRVQGERPHPGYVRLPIPLNGGGEAECWALDWYRCYLPLTKLEETFLRPPVAPEVARKLKNTLSLCRAMWDLLEQRYPNSIKLPWRGVSRRKIQKWTTEMNAKAHALKGELRSLKRQRRRIDQYVARLCKRNPLALRILTDHLKKPDPPDPKVKRDQIVRLRNRLSKLGVVLPSHPPSWLDAGSHGAQREETS